jgi:hypothetical protein
VFRTRRVALSRATLCRAQRHSSRCTCCFQRFVDPPLSASGQRSCLYASGTATKLTRPGQLMVRCCSACFCSYGLHARMRRFVRDLQSPNYLTVLTFRSTFRPVKGSLRRKGRAMPVTKFLDNRGPYTHVDATASHFGRNGRSSSGSCERLRGSGDRAVVWRTVRCVHGESAGM